MRARPVVDLLCLAGSLALGLVPAVSANAADVLGPDDFELDFGSWSNVAGDDSDWTRDSGGTPSTGTGPADDHTATGGGFYLYTEATGGQTGDLSSLDSPCIDLTAASDANLSLWYHMLGANMGNLRVQVASSAGAACGALTAFAAQDSWTGNQDLWIQRNVNLDAFIGGSLQIRILGERGAGFTSDMAIDDVLVTATLGPQCVTDPDCDDLNDCSDDVCNAGTCEYTNNSASCEDGNSCTTGDVCSAGLCQPGAQTCGALADYVIHISVEGMPSDLLQARIDTPGYENLKRFVDEGASTFNARIDYTQSSTNPNHASMVSGRPVEQPAGQPNTVHHGYIDNGDPQASWTYHGPPPCGSPSHCNENVSYIASTFDVAHDNGLLTALYASKAKFVIMDQSYDADSGAPDATGPDDGTDKIDFYVNKESGSPLNGSEVHADFMADMAANRFHYTLLHYRDPDSAGHDFGWGSAQWDTSMQNVDDRLGEIFNLVETDPILAGRTAILLTADHGGQGGGHGNPAVGSIYTIPLFAWGAGVDAGVDLYELNPVSRQDPAATLPPGGSPQPRPDYNAARAPIRDGGSGNLALYLLGLGSIPGSTINSAQDLRTRAPPVLFTAYNDCVHDAALSDTNPHGTAVHYKHPNATFYGIGTICSDCGSSGSGTSYSFTSGRLIDVGTGDPTSVTVTFTQNGGVTGVDWQSQVGPAGSFPGTWDGGYDPTAGSDAQNTFGGIVDMTGTISYGGAGWWVDLTLSGLDPALRYTFATSAARSNPTGDYPIRATIYTLSGADASSNASSTGVSEIVPTSVSFVTGDNDTDGYVARWTSIDPGADGSITVRAEADPTSPQGRLAYAFDVFMLEALDAVSCGDGVLDAGEDCDSGAANGTPGQCCSATCSFELAALECRASAGLCDVPETCTGASEVCPGDVLVPAASECRAAADVCDTAEVCDGTTATCPADVFEPATTECRASAGLCDVAEICTGSGASCPPDVLVPAASECRVAAGVCDAAEACDGASPICPTDSFEPATTECRASAGLCDVAESCTGSGASCPADALLPAATECRAAADVCDAAEVCDGVAPSCPADGFQPATTECRGSAGLCDVAETCTGSGVSCPADVLVPAASECRVSAGACDPAEVCDGVAPACPADAFEPATTECRASAGLCDVAETCTGSGVSCPVDVLLPAASECRPSAGVCDPAEVCDGVAPSCAADGFQPATTECRASADVCDVAELCTGSGAACPADGFASPGSECRAASGVCDVAELCSGSGAACPGDTFLPASTECRSSAGVCDAAEFCDGASPGCGVDIKLTAECRAASGACDAAESCDGVGDDCPADALEPATTVCRSSAGICDISETCTGVTPTCPADGVEPANTICRGSSGSCDPAEQCDGATTACPANVLEPATTVCRALAGACDVEETCTGSSGACPVDAFESSTSECRAPTGACDVAESCSGTGAACPADGVAPAATECRGVAGVCDAAETCDGVDPACPADLFEPATTECRSAAGVCDVAETCSGTEAACPGDSLLAAATECRPTAGPCDLAEACDGSNPACPADAMLPAMTDCRSYAGLCDVVETCDGASAVCPSDAFLPASVGCRGNFGSCDEQENCTGLGALCPPDGFKPASAVCRPQFFACDLPEFCSGFGIFCPTDDILGVGEACDDGNACTVGDECLADLACAAAGPLDCDDGDRCTADSCDSVTGCGHAVIAGCAPGLPATSSWGLLALTLLMTLGGAMLLKERQIRTDR